MGPEPSVADLLRDWLFECKIENSIQLNILNGDTTLKGFGWAIEIEGPILKFTHRLDNDIVNFQIADPTSLDQIKSKILQIEGGVINYLIEHVDDDGWKTWKPPKDRP